MLLFRRKEQVKVLVPVLFKCLREKLKKMLVRSRVVMPCVFMLKMAQGSVAGGNNGDDEDERKSKLCSFLVFFYGDDSFLF